MAPPMLPVACLTRRSVAAKPSLLLPAGAVHRPTRSVGGASSPRPSVPEVVVHRSATSSAASAASPRCQKDGEVTHRGYPGDAIESIKHLRSPHPSAGMRAGLHSPMVPRTPPSVVSNPSVRSMCVAVRGGRRVWFNTPLNSTHDITPYDWNQATPSCSPYDQSSPVHSYAGAESPLPEAVSSVVTMKDAILSGCSLADGPLGLDVGPALGLAS
eukprot:TRINITY_DN92557_c0_g1_i1.p1 TRINITY_DN92557_c0_g1~~TRINITY_DN92557_c0_g1_i1.p1  ORF type:complete len:214 (-),score=20.05 TRINITY_DN92557_c0_g1_i1:265-906(-)